MGEAVEAGDLVRSYGATKALRGVSFEVRQGEIFGLVGPNGAGKTTTVEIIAGLRRPDSGSVSILGLDPFRDEWRLRTLLGIQQQESELPERLRVREAMELFSSFYPRTLDWESLIDRMNLSEKLDSFFYTLSGGQKRRLFIAIALLSDPDVVILDELTSGLDPQGRRMLWELVEDMRASGKTILLTTHYMDEAQQLCDRVGIIDRGVMVVVGTPQELISRISSGIRLLATLGSGSGESCLAAVRKIGGVESASLDSDGHTLTANASSGTVLVELVRVLDSVGADLGDLRTERPTLEDVFLAVTGREMRD